MSLQGDLEAIPLADVLQMIGANRRSGTLYVASDEAARVLTFSDGKVTTGSSLEQRFLLGKVLCQRGIVDPIQLGRALQRQREDRKRLGQTLLAMGLVDAGALADVLREQVQSVMNDVFRWRRGGFLFDDAEPGGDVEAELEEGFDVQSMLMEALRASDEWERISQRFADRDAVPRLNNPDEPLAKGRPGASEVVEVAASESTAAERPQVASSDAVGLLEIIDGYRSIELVVQRSSWNEHRALTALAELFDLRLIRLRTGATSKHVVPQYQRAYSSHVPVTPRAGARAVAVAITERPSELELKELALSDPGLAVSLLRSAGAMSSEGQRVATVSEALRTLGPELSRRSLVGGGLRGLYASGKPWLEMWRHSLATSVAARLVARAVVESPDEIELARFAGLCHDVGCYLLRNAFAEGYEGVEADVRAGARRIDAERRRLGVGHDTVGAHAIESWGAAGVVREAVLLHHAGTTAVPPMAAIVALADAIAHRRGFATSKAEPTEEAFSVPRQVLGLSEEAVSAVERSFIQVCAAREPLW